MPFYEAGDAASVPSTTPEAWWKDASFIAAFNEWMGPTAPDRDGYDQTDNGFRQYPRDPRWLIWLTVAACIFAAVSLVVILVTANR